MAYFFFFNDTATTEIYTLSLHDALPICHGTDEQRYKHRDGPAVTQVERHDRRGDRHHRPHGEVYALRPDNERHPERDDKYWSDLGQEVEQGGRRGEVGSEDRVEEHQHREGDVYAVVARPADDATRVEGPGTRRRPTHPPPLRSRRARPPPASP